MREIPQVIVLRIGRRTRRAMTAAVGLVAGPAILLSALSLAGVTPRRSPPSSIALIGLAFLARAAWILVGLARSRVVVRGEAIEVTRFLWPTRRFLRADVTARRFHAGGFRRSPYHVLVLRDGRSVSLPPYLEPVADLRAFLADIPLLPRGRSCGA